MLRKNALNCKLIQIKSTAKDLFEDFMSSFRPELETCPFCGCRGNCKIHAYYGRFLTDIVHGVVRDNRVQIMRVICDCGHTHAVLPDPIIPYNSFSLFFVLRVLLEHFLGLKTVEQLCESYSISPEQFYRWKNVFKDHRREWLGLVDAMEQKKLASLKSLISFTPFRRFASGFFERTGLTFLQTHKNPAFSQRARPRR